MVKLACALALDLALIRVYLRSSAAKWPLTVIQNLETQIAQIFADKTLKTNICFTTRFARNPQPLLAADARR